MSPYSSLTGMFRKSEMTTFLSCFLELERNISISNIPSCLNNRFYICWHSQEIYQYFAKYALDILFSVLNSPPYSYEFFQFSVQPSQYQNYLTASLENLENWKTILPKIPISWPAYYESNHAAPLTGQSGQQSLS